MTIFPLIQIKTLKVLSFSGDIESNCIIFKDRMFWN